MRRTVSNKRHVERNGTLRKVEVDTVSGIFYKKGSDEVLESGSFTSLDNISKDERGYFVSGRTSLESNPAAGRGPEWADFAHTADDL